jgi:hypothetical protein
MFFFNKGKCFSTVICNPNGNGYVVTVTNVAKGVTMEVSNPIGSYSEALDRAKRYAGHSVSKPIDPDAYEQYLSERLGF